MKKIFAFIALALLTLPTLSAQTATPKHETAKTSEATSAPASQPEKAEIEAALQRTLGYDSKLTWEVVDIHPSSIPGVTEAVVVVNKQQSVHIFLVPGTQQAIIGEILPFGSNPFAPARAKLKTADGPVLGSPTPTILMVEFSDLECPHCKAAQPVLEKLITDFPQIRYIFQQFPLPAKMHPWAMQAAKYANCAGRTSNDSFWKYTDSIFQNQDAFTADNADAKLKELATASGLDADKIAACAATPETEAKVKKSMELGESLDVTSTPTVFINGRKVESLASIPYDSLKQLVQFEIDHADK